MWLTVNEVFSGGKSQQAAEYAPDSHRQIKSSASLVSNLFQTKITEFKSFNMYLKTKTFGEEIMQEFTDFDFNFLV